MTGITTVVEVEPLDLHELARAVGAEEHWIVRLVEVEILHVDAPQEPPERWHFRSGDLQRALAARRLERDFGTNLDAAALILELQEEVRRLRAVLGTRGIS